MIDKVYALQYTKMDTSYVYTKKMNVCVCVCLVFLHSCFQGSSTLMRQQGMFPQMKLQQATHSIWVLLLHDGCSIMCMW